MDHLRLLLLNGPFPCTNRRAEHNNCVGMLCNPTLGTSKKMYLSMQYCRKRKLSTPTSPTTCSSAGMIFINALPMAACCRYLFCQCNETNFYIPALESLRDLVRSSTTSMTSVPMSFKFLHDHCNRLKEACNKMEDLARSLCCSIVSVLASGQAQKGELDCLKYYLLSQRKDVDIVDDWGHKYVRQLEDKIAEEWNNADADQDQLLELIQSIVDFYMRFNAEIQACDLLMEIDQLDLLHMDQSNYLRGSSESIGTQLRNLPKNNF